MRFSANWTAKYMFTGQEKDKETGLYNYRARLYDPYLKRFLDTDPAGQGFSPYAYAGNNPVVYVDPTGEYIHSVVVITAQAITTAEAIAATTAFTAAAATTISIASQSQQILLAQTVPPNTSDQAIREGINNYKKYDGLNIPDASPQTPQKNPLNSFDPIEVKPSYGSLQEQPLSPARYYGGDGSGSLMDITMKGLDVVNQFNPVANAWDYVTYVAYGTDRLGNSMSHFGGYMSAFSAVPFLSATKSLTFTKFGVKTGSKAVIKHGHHSFPKFLGGAKKQILTKMAVDEHKMLHKDLISFLKEKAPGMVPKRGNPGILIRQKLSYSQRVRIMAEFYKGPGKIYKEAAADFFKQFPNLK